MKSLVELENILQYYLEDIFEYFVFNYPEKIENTVFFIQVDYISGEIQYSFIDTHSYTLKKTALNILCLEDLDIVALNQDSGGNTIPVKNLTDELKYSLSYELSLDFEYGLFEDLERQYSLKFN